MISSIQIFVFLPLLQVEMPLILKSYLEAQKNYYPAYEFFKDVIDDGIEPFKKVKDFKYHSSNFILNIGRPLFILSIIIFVDLLSYLDSESLKEN
jgi:hypothetical protein